jgi:uncharacterized protein YecE (DUF72 family)
MSVGSIMGLPGERNFVNERAGVNGGTCRIGVAGWGLSRAVADRFPAAGTHLERYASVLPAVEINSCFYRHHRPGTYAKWAASVPDGFRFSVKLPKAITHDAGLAAWEPVLGRFLDESASLGEMLGCVLVQLPPRLAFDAPIAEAFFRALRARYAGPLALEPRHATWGADAPEQLLRELGIARVAADPVRSQGRTSPPARTAWCTTACTGRPASTTRSIRARTWSASRAGSRTHSGGVPTRGASSTTRRRALRWGTRSRCSRECGEGPGVRPARRRAGSRPPP